jgi:hypothetical protein
MSTASEETIGTLSVNSRRETRNKKDARNSRLANNQCCGSGIRCLFDPWIRDPGWVEVSIRIRDEQPGSYFLELRNHFFGVKTLKFFYADPGWKKVGFEINIPDPPHCQQQY